jgi:hypothetical protein
MTGAVVCSASRTHASTAEAACSGVITEVSITCISQPPRRDRVRSNGPSASLASRGW